jgi:hypothetical protein
VLCEIIDTIQLGILYEWANWKSKKKSRNPKKIIIKVFLDKTRETKLKTTIYTKIPEIRTILFCLGFGFFGLNFRFWFEFFWF